MITINQEIKIAGKCLMGGQECNVSIKPSDKEGIYFYVKNSDTPIKASVDNVISTANCTVLGNDSSQIKLVEHFLAACAILRINAINVYLDTDEMPILDGSSLEWVILFNNTGINGKNTDKSYQITTPVYFHTDKSSIIMLPANEFSVSYAINFDHPDLVNRWYKWNSAKGIGEIIEARTFGYLKDLEKFQKIGFALGADINNTVGLTEDSYTVELRSEYEPIKHKILDLIGDLYLSGYNPLDIKAQIIACEAGHTTHVKLAQIFKQHMESES